ncbi:MAG: hypothetical protein IMW98_08485 [Firmicutes bacterium]|nr:hypothetical protein [Bacillota bacterium]MBE3590842.1 hypothetical protein [Bacillota bacterium]
MAAAAMGLIIGGIGGICIASWMRAAALADAWAEADRLRLVLRDISRCRCSALRCECREMAERVLREEDAA